MLKLFKNLSKKDVGFIVIAVILISCGVWFDLKLPDYMSGITQLIQTNGTMNQILEKGMYMLGCAAGSLVCAVIVGYLAATISSSFSMKLREKIFHKVASFSNSQINKFQTSSLITRTTNDVTQIEMLIAMGLQMLVKAPIMAVLAISKILDKSVELSMLIAVCVAVLLVVVVIIMMIVMPRFQLVQKLIDKVNGVIRENLSGIRVVRAFNAEDFEAKRFEEVNDELTETQLFNQRVFAVMMPVMNFVMNFLSVAIYYVGMLLIDKALLYDKVQIFSNVVVFTSYGMQVIMAFLMLAMIFMILPRASISANRINEVLDEPLTIMDGSFDGNTDVKGEVEFKNVSFKYPGADENVIENISFKVKKGQTIAFIGSTGSGKSTLINLVPRFYDCTEGEIDVDGVNIKDYKQDALHEKIGYISQKAFMFDGSIEENVNYGHSHLKQRDVKNVEDACQTAMANEFISKMEKGYDSHIARGGTNVSGGQKQRLSIARAISFDPEIYIFDDSFSALDFKTDASLRKALRTTKKDATFMIVAQRIGTIMDADTIVVLDRGKAVGIGTHQELLKNCEVYQEIAYSQLSKEELENA